MGIYIGESRNERNWTGVCVEIMMKIIRFNSGKTIIIRTNPVKFQGVIITLLTPVMFVKNVSTMQKFIEHVEEFLKLQVTSRSLLIHHV